MSLFLCYHYPCLDGAFSLLSAFLGIKSYISKYKFENLMLKLNDLDYLATPRSCSTVSSSSSSSFTEEKKQQTVIDVRKPGPNQIEQEKTRQSPKKIRKQSLCNINSPPFDIQMLKMEDPNLTDPAYFHPAIHPNIRYVPLMPSSMPDKILEAINSHITKKDDLENSIIILMDFYGGSSENIKTLAKIFKKVIILDHHISFLKLIDLNLFKDLKNLYHKFDLAKSGCTVTYDFFKQNFELERLCSFGVLKRLQELLPSIQDDDIKAEKIAYSRDVTSGLYHLVYEFNPQKDSLLFYRLLTYNLQSLKDIGFQVNKDKEIQVDQEIQNQRKIFVGGQKNCICIGYGINPQENSLVGDIAVKLAQLSLNDQLDNIGIGFIKINIDGKQHYQISLRSSKLKEGICDTVAEKYGGGGHKGASGFTISRQDFHKWIQ